MNCFIVKIQPKSFNRWKKKKSASYISKLQNAFKKDYPSHSLTSEDLYAVVYYFFKIDLNHDADNISKPVLDSLTSIIYHDDKQIKIRIAGTFNLNSKDFKEMNVTGIPSSVLTQLIDSIDKEDHTLYIECGKLKSDHYKFGME